MSSAADLPPRLAAAALFGCAAAVWVYYCYEGQGSRHRRGGGSPCSADSENSRYSSPVAGRSRSRTGAGDDAAAGGEEDGSSSSKRLDHKHGHGSEAMRSLVSAFNDAANASPPPSPTRQATPPRQPPPPPAAATGPPPLGSILQLVKETGRSRKECKAALVAHANDYDAARWSLMPNPPGADDGDGNADGSGDGSSSAEPAKVGCGGCAANASSAALPGVFEPAPKFVGGRPGWLYKRGPLGVGYYRDAPMNVAVAKEG